jgi:peptidylprolyl isomerase domain and WD repeat-containing protein 1
MKDRLVLGDQAVIHTSMGDIEVELYKEDAPITVDNFINLAKKGYYNNLTWHRVIKGFMIQGGDPTGDGTGGESAGGGYFQDEINPTSLGLSGDQIKKLEEKGYKYNYKLKSHKMDVGSLAMANAGPNTNGSQFFIVTEKAQPHLDGQHTVFGKVTSGLEIAQKISEVPVDDKDKPTEPVLINSVELK